MTMSDRTIRVGTRTSSLAMAQTDEVVSILRSSFPSTQFQIVPITSDGDRRKDAPLLSLGRGTFAKRLELALLDGDIDMAVHSAKDLASALPDGLAITAYPERRDPRDVIVNRWGLPFADLPSGATLGTSSPRRCGQLLSVRPDITFVPIRGNVDTRLSKVGTDDCDGVVLAAAGLQRLGRLNEATEILTPELCVPDAGQGALAVETQRPTMNADDPICSRRSTTRKPGPPLPPSAHSSRPPAGAAACRSPPTQSSRAAT